MTSAKTIAGALLAAVALLVSVPCVARARVGVFVGIPLGPWVYPTPYYYYPPYPYYPYSRFVYPPVVIAPPAEYVEQAPSPGYAAPPAPSVYYYCLAANAYYPYVRECPGNWEQVPIEPR